MTKSQPSSGFRLTSRRVGALPIVNHFLAAIGADEALLAHVVSHDARLKLAPARVLGVVLRNLVVDHEPIYALGEWAGVFEGELLGLGAGELELLNDDRVGRALELLFDADRASLLTTVVLGAVRAFGIDCSELHNDSTTVSFAGEYSGADGRPRGGKPTAQITFGYNKDHRPDLRQLVWILTVSADGAVPIAHRVVAGNTNDESTHVRSWDELCAILGRRDFLYVADSKLSNRSAMDHIDASGGRFVTVLPRSRREDAWFRDWVSRHGPEWVEAIRVPSRRADQPPDVLSTFESPLGSAEGYRIIWIHSTAKASRDAAIRAHRLEHAERELAALAARLGGPKARIRTRVAAEEAARAILAETNTAEFFDLDVAEEIERSFTASHRGSPGPETTFRQKSRSRSRLSWRLRIHAVRRVACSDGCWPLMTNDGELSPVEVLTAYRYQPHLERRHHCLKGAQAVAPVHLHSPARIEALLCCHFLALLVHALIERQVRAAMATGGTPAIALYPEDRDCPAPSAARVLEIFANLSRHHLIQRGQVVEVFEPELDDRQRAVLDLLGVPSIAYRNPR